MFVEDFTCLALCLALWGLQKELKTWFYPKGKRNLWNHYRTTPASLPSCFLLGWAFRDLWLRPKEKHSERQAWSWAEEGTDWGWQRGRGAWEVRRDLRQSAGPSGKQAEGRLGSALVLGEADGADWVSGGCGRLIEPLKLEELDWGLSRETTVLRQAWSNVMRR